MPFKAIDAKTRELVVSLDYNSKLELMGKRERFLCCVCNQDMHCRERTDYALHFVHNSNASNCPSSKESWQHLECKRLIYLGLKSRLAKSPTFIRNLFAVDLEYRVRRINRVIDVALLRQNRPVEAHEVQLSPIPVSDLEARTTDYSSAGIATYWYFDKQSLTPEIQQWSENKFGEVRTFDLKGS